MARSGNATTSNDMFLRSRSQLIPGAVVFAIVIGGIAAVARTPILATRATREDKLEEWAEQHNGHNNVQHA